MATRRPADTRGDAERSFEQLYRGHRVDVYRAALRDLGNVQDAEDVTQAAFVDAYRAVLRGTRPASPRAWLLAIAENVRRRRARTSLRRPREEPLEADAALAAEESHERAGALLEALESLTAEQRQAFLLREIKGLSYDEIAERTDSSVSSVQMLLFRARKSLRDELDPPQGYGALVPLTTLFARFETLSFAPRAAGALGAAALAVGVSASMPAEPDPPLARPVAPALATVAPSRVPRAAKPIEQRSAEPVAAKRRVQPTEQALALARVAARPAALAPRDDPSPPGPATKPEPEPPRSSRATVIAPAVPTPPSLPLASPLPTLLEALVEPVLESPGAAGAVLTGAPPLPERPLDSVPPIP